EAGVVGVFGAYRLDGGGGAVGCGAEVDAAHAAGAEQRRQPVGAEFAGVAGGEGAHRWGPSRQSASCRTVRSAPSRMDRRWIPGLRETTTSPSGWTATGELSRASPARSVSPVAASHTVPKVSASSAVSSTPA